MAMSFAASLGFLFKPSWFLPNVVLVQALGFAIGVAGLFMGMQFGDFSERVTRALAVGTCVFIVTCVTLALAAITAMSAMLILAGVAGVVALGWAACNMSLRHDRQRRTLSSSNCDAE